MQRLRFWHADTLSAADVAAWAAVAVLLLGMLGLLHGLPVESSDFYDFYLAARTLLQGGDPYAPQPNGVQGFFNPLWAAFPFVPLTAWGAPHAFDVWQALLLLLLVAASVPLFRVYRVVPGPLLVLLTGWLFLLPWFVGQNAPLVAAGAFLAICFGARGRWGLAGAMAPLLAIKPQTVLFFPLLLLARGRGRAFWGGLLGGGGATLAALALMPRWLWAWLGSRWGQSQGGAGESWPASGLPNALEFLHLPAWLYGATVVIALLLLLWRRHDPWREQAALSLSLGVLVAPYVRAGDFPLLLPALLLLPPRWRRGVALIAMGLFFVGTPIPLLWFIPATVTGALVAWLARAEPAATA